MLRPLLLQGQQAALDSADRGAADVAILVLKSFGVVTDILGDGAQILKSSSSRPRSSAMRKIIFSTPDWTSLRFNNRASSSGPRSDTVARTGWPFSPKISHTTAGLAWGCQSVTPIFSSRACSFSELWPARQSRSDRLYIGHKHRYADFGKGLRQFCRVTVLPVPVAPVIRPWRLAIPGSKCSCFPACGQSAGCAHDRFLHLSCVDYRQTDRKPT